MATEKYTSGGKTFYRAEFQHRGEVFRQRGFPTKKDAREWIEATRRGMETEDAEAVDYRLKAFAYDYLKFCASHFAKSTTRYKGFVIQDFFTFVGRNLRLDEIKRDGIFRYQAKLLDEKGPKTANRYLRELKSAWNFHIHHLGLALPNPFYIPPVPEEAFRKYVPPKEDVDRVLAVADQFQRDFLTVILMTAARAGELRALRWDAVDFAGDALTLFTRKRKGGNLEPRTMHMNPTLKSILARLREGSASEWVFTNPHTGKPLKKMDHAMRYMLARLCEKAGVHEFGFHSLRHFVALRLRDQHHVSGFEIQSVLGHQRLTTTDTYLKSFKAPTQNALNSLGSEFIPSTPTG